MDLLDEREVFIGSGMKLARILGSDRNSVGYALRRLEKKGCLKRIMVNGHVKRIEYIPPF
jgi:DNA-binding MarR family transcriptional regulator